MYAISFRIRSQALGETVYLHGAFHSPYSFKKGDTVTVAKTGSSGHYKAEVLWVSPTVREPFSFKYEHASFSY